VKQLRSPKHRALIAAVVKARQVNVLEFIEVARVLGVKAAALMEEIEG